MHEYNVCQTIVDTVLDRLNRMEPRPARLLRTKVVIGRLRGLSAENLAASFTALAMGTAAQGAALDVETAPARGTCAHCRWTGEIGEGTFYCPTCGSSAGTLSGGRELYLESMEVEQD